MEPTTIDSSYRRDDRGKNVRRIQEWLCLHGLHEELPDTRGDAAGGWIARGNIGIPSVPRAIHLR
jgi:hypothetical protein